MLATVSGPELLVELAAQMHHKGGFFSRSRKKAFSRLLHEPATVRHIDDVLEDLEGAVIGNTPIEIRAGHSVSARTLFNALANIIAANIAMVFDHASKTVRLQPESLDMDRLRYLVVLVEALVDLDDTHDIIHPDHVSAIRRQVSSFAAKARQLARRLDIDTRVLDAWADSKNNL